MSSDNGKLIGNGIVAILAGLTFGIFIDRDQLKLVLHQNPRDKYSIYQVEAIFISGLIGLGFGAPISYLQKHIKLYYVIVIGCFGATISLLLLWTISDSYGWYSSTTISIFNFLAGYSVAHIYYTSLWVGFSASSHLNLVTLFHHLPLVSSALVLRLIVSNTYSYLFSIEFCATILATVAAIVLLRTSPTIEEPVRVVGEARRFTLPAYEYPASDTESIAESDISTAEALATLRSPLLPQPIPQNRFKRVFGDLLTAVPYIFVFAVPTAINMPFSSATKPPAWRLFVCVVSSSLAALLGNWRTISRPMFLILILGARSLFLLVAVLQHEVPPTDFSYDTEGIVQGAFWTMLPQMLFELHGYKRITLLWSTGILTFALLTAVRDFLAISFVNNASSMPICTSGNCDIMISLCQLLGNLFCLVAVYLLRTKLSTARN